MGLSFVEGYPDNILTLNDDVWFQETGEAFAGVLTRNPANPHDANAIEVHVPAIGMIGHLPREVSAALAPLIDAGNQYMVHVEPRVDPDHPSHPGATCIVWAV